MIHKSLPVFAGCVLIAMLAVAHRSRIVRGPDTLAAAAQAARTKGLWCRSDTPNGAVKNRLIISEQPLAFERVNSLYLGMPHHACWKGIVAVYAERSWTFAYSISGVARATPWGELFVIGDPVLVQKLTQ
jgi:hypothetical protein